MTEHGGQSSQLPRRRTLNARGKLISLEHPVAVGILNLTPDSFHAGSRIRSAEEAVGKAGVMLEEGAVAIDIGGASSRPGAEVISVGEELGRLMPVLGALLQAYPDAVFSVDTWRAGVAHEALDAGAHIINDITCGTMDPDILGEVADAGAPYVAMHMLGTPGKMPARPEYRDIPGDILHYFVNKIRTLKEAGIRDIILDPGFGFGKSVEQNFTLLRSLGIFRFLELPVMIGISRKSMIWRSLETSPEDALNGTTALHMVALQQGVLLLRVHDVKEAIQTIKLYGQLAV